MPVSLQRAREILGGEWETRPQCPHCRQTFEAWHDAKRHVKYCKAGKHPRKFIRTTASGQTARNLLGEELRMKLQPQALGSSTQLLPGMIANLGDTAKIVDVRPAGKQYQFSDVCIDLQFGKKKFELPVKYINEDFQEIAKKLGLDTDKWTGKTVHLSTEPYISNRTGKESDIIRFELSVK